MREQMAAGRPDPVEVVIGEDDAEDPQGDLHPRHSQFLATECDRPGHGSQNRESGQTSGAIPKEPSARVVLLQAQELGSHHRNEGGHKTDWGGARTTGLRCPSSFSPFATILSSASGNGRCNFSASGICPSSHRSTSPGDVRMTGIALGWIGATIALASVVRKPNNSCCPYDRRALGPPGAAPGRP